MPSTLEPQRRRADPDPPTEAYKKNVKVGQAVHFHLNNGVKIEGIYKGHDTADGGAYRLIELSQYPGCLLEVPNDVITYEDIKRLWPTLLRVTKL